MAKKENSDLSDDEFNIYFKLHHRVNVLGVYFYADFVSKENWNVEILDSVINKTLKEEKLNYFLPFDIRDRVIFSELVKYILLRKINELFINNKGETS